MYYLYYLLFDLLQNAMKFNAMNHKRSLSPLSNNANTPNKHHRQNFHYNGDIKEERKQLPMWAAKDSFIKEITK